MLFFSFTNLNSQDFDVNFSSSTDPTDGTIKVITSIDPTDAILFNYLRIEVSYTFNDFQACNADGNLIINDSDYTINTNGSNETIMERMFLSSQDILPNSPTQLFENFIFTDPGQCVTVTLEDARYVDLNSNPSLIVASNIGATFQVCSTNDPLSGKIERADNITCIGSINSGMPDVDVEVSYDYVNSYNCDPTQTFLTTGNGLYNFDSYANQSRTISCSNDADMMCGLSNADENEIRGFLNGTDPFTEVWEYIAADLSGNDIITTLDIALLNKLNLGIDDPNTYQSWFFPTAASYISETIDPNNTSYHPLLDYELAFSGTGPYPDEDFYGIKLGDLNSSCTDCTTSLQNENPSTRNERIFADINYKINRKKNYLEIEITDNTIISMVEFISSMQFNASEIEIISSELVNAFDNYTFEKENTLFKFYLNQSIQHISGDKVLIRIPNYLNIKEIIVEDELFNAYKIMIPNEKLEIYPNPSSDMINISLINPAPYIIYNSTGTMIQQGKTAGKLDISNLSSGVYFLDVMENGLSRQAKFIKL